MWQVISSCVALVCEKLRVENKLTSPVTTKELSKTNKHVSLVKKKRAVCKIFQQQKAAQATYQPKVSVHVHAFFIFTATIHQTRVASPENPKKLNNMYVFEKFLKIICSLT